MDELSWTTPEYIFREKSVDWYWIVGIVTLCIVLLCIIFQNLILAILVFISAFLLTMLGSRTPKNITVTLNQRGIVIDGHESAYKEYESYWVELQDPYPRILFKPKKIIATYTTVLLPREKGVEAKKFLNRFLKEELHQESLLEKLFIYFGF